MPKYRVIVREKVEYEYVIVAQNIFIAGQMAEEQHGRRECDPNSKNFTYGVVFAEALKEE